MNIITREMHYDSITPISVYAALAGDGACIFESAHDEGYGIYSYIGVNPLGTFTASDRNVTIKMHDGTITQEVGDPYALLEKFVAGRKAFGFIAYDAIRLKERIPDRHKKANVPLDRNFIKSNDTRELCEKVTTSHLKDYDNSANQIPDFLFHIYTTIIKFEHKNHKLILMHEGTEETLDAIITRINNPQILHTAVITKSDGATKPNIAISSDVSDDEFMEMVEKAKEYIRAGDIFQVVLSRTFTTQITVPALDIYRALRRTNPTPYLAFFNEGDYAIASASPELLVGVKDGTIEIAPIAGTARANDDIDLLLTDPKENAEHVMLVDLARNDIGIVSTPGTVRVTEYKGIKALSHVTHIISRVAGMLASGISRLDVLQAVLPAGTLSGAPKIRAMEIIDELEHSRRGLYGGTIMLLDENSNITSSIAIRTAVIRKDIVELRTGAGIVLDSIPSKEAAETKLKAQGVIAAIELAQQKGGTA